MRRIGGEKRLEPDLRLWVLSRLKGLQRDIELLDAAGRASLPRSRRSSVRSWAGEAAAPCRVREGRRRRAPRARAARSAELSPAGAARRARSDRRWDRMRPTASAVEGRPAGPGPRALRRRRLRRSAFGAVAEPEFDVLAELLQLRLEPMLGVLQFLDPAVRRRSSSSSRLTRITSPAASSGSPAPPPGMSAGGAAWWWKRSNWA